MLGRPLLLALSVASCRHIRPPSDPVDNLARTADTVRAALRIPGVPAAGRVALGLAIAATGVLPVASCRDNAQSADRAASSASALAESGRAVRPRDPMPDNTPLGAHRPAELEEAAKQVIRFLRGEVGFHRIRIADTVTFYVSPEGGGTRTALTRHQLRDRSKWKVHVLGMEPSLVPPQGLTRLTTRVGRHFNCREYPLSSRFAELALLPHVGTRLDRGEESSCLETRNLTLVFDPDERPPTLVAAVHDQWEW